MAQDIEQIKEHVEIMRELIKDVDYRISVNRAEKIVNFYVLIFLVCIFVGMDIHMYKAINTIDNSYVSMTPTNAIPYKVENVDLSNIELRLDKEYYINNLEIGEEHFDGVEVIKVDNSLPKEILQADTVYISADCIENSIVHTILGYSIDRKKFFIEPRELVKD